VVASGKCKARSNAHQATSSNELRTSKARQGRRAKQAQGSSVVGWKLAAEEKAENEWYEGTSSWGKGVCDRKCKTKVRLFNFGRREVIGEVRNELPGLLGLIRSVTSF